MHVKCVCVCDAVCHHSAFLIYSSSFHPFIFSIPSLSPQVSVGFAQFTDESQATRDREDVISITKDVQKFLATISQLKKAMEVIDTTSNTSGKEREREREEEGEGEKGEREKEREKERERGRKREKEREREEEGEGERERGGKGEREEERERVCVFLCTIKC